MRRMRHDRRWNGVAVWVLAAMTAAAWPTGAEAEADDPPVRVARVTYADREAERCFSSAFLTLADRTSAARIDRSLHDVALTDERLAGFPVAVMVGEGPFELSEAETEALGAYLRRGGVVLASSRCADGSWGAGFTAAVRDAVGGELEPLGTDHAVFSTLFEIARVETVRPHDAPLWGVSIDGRLAVVYSPLDLYDGETLGRECCCCGGNAVRNAQRINANVLLYALTR